MASTDNSTSTKSPRFNLTKRGLRILKKFAEHNRKVERMRAGGKLF